MSDLTGGYKPQDKNSILEELVCPNCGLDVPESQYNEITQLINCTNCEFVFAFNPEIENEAVKIDMDNIDVGSPVKGIKRPNSLLPIIILVLAVLCLAIIKMIS